MASRDEKTQHRQSGIGGAGAALAARLGAMVRRLLLLALVLMPQAASAQAPGPESIVRLLYQHYIDTTEGLVFAFDYTDPVVASNYFTPTLAHLLVADAADEAPRLDFDPFVNGQDFDIKAVALQTRMRADDKAEVEARFRNFDEEETHVFTIVRTARGWRIADVRGEGHEQSLLEYLSLTN